MIEVIAYRVYGETGWIVPPEKIEAETVKEARAKVRQAVEKKHREKEILLQTREINKT